MTSLHLLTPPLAEFNVVPVPSQLPPLGQSVPAQFSDDYQLHLNTLKEKVTTGAIFDGPVVVLRAWHVAADRLLLEIQASTYVVMSALRKTYTEALLANRLNEADVTAIPSQFGACLCACVSVLTADNQVISLRRPAGFADAGTVALGLGEVLEPRDFDGGPLSLHEAGARALREELGVVLTPEQIVQFVKPMYLARSQEGGAWVFVIVVDLRRAGAEFVADRILAQAELAEDAHESELRRALPFHQSSLDAFIHENRGRLGLWAEELAPLLLRNFT